MYPFKKIIELELNVNYRLKKWSLIKNKFKEGDELCKLLTFEEGFSTCLPSKYNKVTLPEIDDSDIIFMRVTNILEIKGIKTVEVLFEYSYD